MNPDRQPVGEAERREANEVKVCLSRRLFTCLSDNQPPLRSLGTNSFGLHRDIGNPFFQELFNETEDGKVSHEEGKLS